MKQIIVFLILLLSALPAWPTDLDHFQCSSFDSTFYPYFQLSVSRLSDGRFAVFGVETNTHDFKTYETREFWHVAQKVRAGNDVFQFQWPESRWSPAGILKLKFEKKKVTLAVLMPDVSSPEPPVYELVCE